MLHAGRRFLPARLVGAPATATPPVPGERHKRSGYELGAAAVVALGRVAGGVRRTIAATAALLLLAGGALLLVFPRVMSFALAAGAFALALGAGVYAVERRRSREADDGG